MLSPSRVVFRKPLANVVLQFQDAVACYGDRCAVMGDDRCLTYDQLHAEAVRIFARIVQAHERCWSKEDSSDVQNHPRDGQNSCAGITTIAIFISLGCDLVSSTIGALMSGKAVVPLNPSDKAIRLRHILETVEPFAIITTVSTARLARELSPPMTQVIVVDEEEEVLGDQIPQIGIAPESVAYVAFTSGSTGNPKGVIHSHSSLLDALFNLQSIYRYTERDIGTVFGMGTGASLKAMLHPLLHGAGIRVIDPMKIGSKEIADDLVQNRVSVLTISPALYRVVMDSLPEDFMLPRIRFVRLTSDTVFAEDLLRARQRTLPGCKFVNLLATTETGMVSFYSVDLHTDDLKAEGVQTVGKPAQGVEVFLADESSSGPTLQESKTNRGVLCISSSQLMIGYWKQPALTGKRLTAHPKDPNKHLFRSCDVAKIGKDGSITLLGRSDSQVKIRGWLVDLAELERTLASHRLIRNAVAVVSEDSSKQKHIVAFLETNTRERSIDFSELRQILSDKLAAHTIPRHFQFVDQIPLLPSGKADRLRLSETALKIRSNETSCVKPNNEEERLVAAIWSSILGIKSLGIHDNFFQLGGSSLSAMRISMRLEEKLKVRIKPSLVFENPTISELTQRLRRLPKIEKPACGLTKRSDAQSRLPTPLTFAQRRLWFLNQLPGGSEAYNMSSAFLIRGQLFVEVLCEAMRVLVQRHETLRTTIQCDGSDPELITLDSFDFKLDVVELSSKPDRVQQTEVRKRRLELERTPFDLTSDLMLRAELIRLGDREHILQIVTHHIASDGWSKSTLFRELSVIYGALLNNRDPDLPQHELQYRDFAFWQNESGSKSDKQLHYWKERLLGLSDLELPTDRPRPSEVSARGSAKSFTISQETVEALRKVARQTNVTMNAVLCSAFQVILSRYSGQTDFAVAFPTIGRPDRRLESLVGFFANTLLVRAELSGDPSTSDLLKRVSQSFLEAFDNSDVPFDRIVENLHRPRDLSRMPIAQALFQFMEFGQQELELAGAIVSRLPVLGSVVRFDLELQIFPDGENYRGILAYSTDLFDDARMEAFATHYCNLLNQISDHVDRPISHLSILGEEERRDILLKGRGATQRSEAIRGIHELFEAQVAETPHAIASVFGKEHVRYCELNVRANQFAHFLIRSGVDSTSRVGVCVDRSTDVLVAILGILKAGAAYVPIDPELPGKRISQILEQGQIGKLVTDRSQKGRPAEDCRVDRIRIDDTRIKNSPTHNPCVADPRAAYIIFTSGSTGQPKGVEIPHRAAVNFLRSMAAQPGMTPDDVVLGLTTISFDISVLELLLPLTVGARVVIVDRETCRSPDKLISMIKESGATVVQATPTTWRMLIDSGWTGQDHLKVLCGGEPLTKNLAAGLLSRCQQLWNMYGPTETTVWSTIQLIQHQEEHLIIGSPIANTRVYVLDDRMQPLPYGVPGELYIGGQGVALGYFGQPELSASCFLPDSFVDDSEAMMYRTGDTCVWERDGRLRFVGRADRQVKLRGFRIELEEIESVCEEYPEMRQVAVVMQENAAGGGRLIACCVPNRLDEFQPSSIRKFIQERLPEYMVPQAIVQMDELPTTPSGKIDRNRLLALNPVKSTVQVACSPPHGPIETRLAQLWCDVLGLDEVGAEENFFELGGHSLLAVSLFKRMREEFGKTLPLATLFRGSTIRQLARALIEFQDENKLVTSTILQTGQGGQPLFVMPTIGGDLLFMKPVVDALCSRLPIIGLQPALNANNLNAFQDFQQTASYYLSVIKTEQPEGPYALTGFSYGGLLAYEIARQLREQGEEVNILAIIDCGITRRIQAKPSRDALRVWLSLPMTLPSWLGEELRYFSVRNWVGKIRRRIRQRRLGLRWEGENRVEVEDIFEEGQIPTQNKQLMKTVFAAFRDYQPQPYAGRLYLLKAKTRALLRVEQHDLGWQQVAEDVVVHEIAGNHETILRDPNVRHLAMQLDNLLAQATRD